MFNCKIKYNDTNVNIEFPCTNLTLYEKLADLHVLDEEKSKMDIYIEEVSYEPLKCLEGKLHDPDAVNLLAKKIEVSSLKSKYEKHFDLYTELKEKVAERTKLKAELDKTPKLQIFKRSELMGKINTLSEQIEDLKSEKSILLDELGCADDKDISKINSRIYDITEALAKMERHTDNCKDGNENALQEFDELYMQTSDMDSMELIEERLRIRPQAEQEAETELRTAYKDNFSRDTFKDSIRLTDKDLHEDLYAERSSIIRKLRAYKQQQQEQCK